MSKKLPLSGIPEVPELSEKQKKQLYALFGDHRSAPEKLTAQFDAYKSASKLTKEEQARDDELIFASPNPPKTQEELEAWRKVFARVRNSPFFFNEMGISEEQK